MVRGAYRFEPECIVSVAPWEAQELLEGRASTLGHGALALREYSADETSITVRVDSEHCGAMEASLDPDGLRGVAGARGLYLATEDGLVRAEIREAGYYQLVSTVPGSYPTLEINGIHMHRVSGTDPLRDTLAKVRAARVRRGHRVLDTCMGLGYTAIHSLKAGASRVVTVEVDPNVIMLARVNPWSWPLASEGIETVRGDVVEVVRELPDEWFDRVIHDPPRLTGRYGDLYSMEFYRELYRVLRRRGVLFHYTGEPGRVHGRNLPGRVASRLREAGFVGARYVRSAQGVVAFKP